MSKISKDSLRRFVFEKNDIKGAWLSLDNSLLELHENQQAYTLDIKCCLNECLAASVLLSSAIKFDGRLSLQARGDGAVKLLLAETLAQQASKDLHIRGIVRLGETQQEKEPSANEKEQKNMLELLGNANLVISIERKQGKTYQSFISLEKSSLAENLVEYFQQSEQLGTYFHIASDQSRAVAFMLQRLPTTNSSDEANKAAADEYWQHCLQLANTLKDEELLDLDDETLLYRLFHQEQIRIFDYQALDFNCGCSKERTAQALKSVGKDEAMNILKETPQIEMDCQFCATRYVFNVDDVAQLFDLDASDRIN